MIKSNVFSFSFLAPIPVDLVTAFPTASSFAHIVMPRVQ